MTQPATPDAHTSTPAGPPGEVLALEPPSEVTETSTAFDVIDPKTGDEREAILTVAAGELTVEALYQAFGALAYSKSPLTINLRLAEHPPLLVKRTEAARLLGCHLKTIINLIDNGWLTPIYYLDHNYQPGGATSPEVAEKTGNFQGWGELVLYEDILKVMAWSIKRGHLPAPKHPNPSAKTRREKRGHTKLRLNAAGIFRVLLEEAKNPDGTQAWVEFPEMYRRVRDHVQSRRPTQAVPYKTVQNAAQIALDKGLIRRKQIKGRANEVRSMVQWVPENERAHQRPEEES